MSDLLAAHGLELPVLEEDLQQRLMALLPSYASAQNPVDGTAQAIHEVGYAKLVEIVRQSQRIDTILLIGSLANEATAKQRAEELAAVTGDTEQPIILSTYTTQPQVRWPVRRGRHPLLHIDAELCPGNPGIGRLRPVSGAATPSAGDRRDRSRGARRCRPHARRRRPSVDRGRGQDAADAIMALRDRPRCS